MQQHPQAARKARNARVNMQTVENRLGAALATLSTMTADGWPSGGDGVGRSSSSESTVERAAMRGLDARAMRWRIDTLLTELENSSAALVALIDEVRGLPVDTTEDARKARCSGWGRHEATCERVAVTRPIDLGGGRFVCLCDRCRQIREHEARAAAS